MFCPKCRTQCRADAKFCHSCGRNLQEQRDSLPHKNENDVGNIAVQYFH